MALALALPFGSGIAAGLRLKGVTIDCVDGRRYNLANIPVFAFDAKKSESLNNLIRDADTAYATDDAEVAKRAWANSERLVHFVRAAPRLASAKSGKDGTFMMEIPNSGSDLIVFAYASSDEGPAFIYAYARVAGKDLAGPVLVAFTPGCGL